MLTACFSVMIHLLLLLIRIAMKLRLSIPLVYLVLMLTAFRPWYRVHTALADRRKSGLRCGRGANHVELYARKRKYYHSESWKTGLYCHSPFGWKSCPSEPTQ